MLERVHIQRFRSCKDVLIENISEMIALVGRNGAGKTNILRAIQWAASSGVSTNPIEPVLGFLSVEPTPSVSFQFRLDGTQYRYSIELLITTERSELAALGAGVLNEELGVLNGNAWSILVSRTGETIRVAGRSDVIQTGKTTPCLPAVVSLLPKEDVVRSIVPVIEFFQAIRYYPLDEPIQPSGFENGLIRHSAYAEWLLKSKSHLEQSTSVVMRLVHMSLERKALFEDLKKLLGADGLDIIKDIAVSQLSIGNESSSEDPVDKSSLIYFVVFKIDQDEQSRRIFVYNDLSYGTRRLLRLLVSMFYDNSSVMLLEQPEDGIHSGLLHKLIPLLLSYDDSTQFIIASHSSEVLNRLEPIHIRLVTMDRGVTSLRALDDDEIKGAERFMKEDGALSEFLEGIQVD